MRHRNFGELLLIVALAIWTFRRASRLLRDAEFQLPRHRNLSNHTGKNTELSEPIKAAQIGHDKEAIKSGSSGSVPSGKAFHFVQISGMCCHRATLRKELTKRKSYHWPDLHISRYNPTGGHYHFLTFLRSVLNIINPEFVFVTGDLTDAKDERKLRSLQYRDEWDAYKLALEQSGVLERRNGSFWWDLRGNHDCFNVPDWSSEVNYFATRSGARAAGFTVNLDKKYGKYLFVGLDGCPYRGLSRPFNFFGIFDVDDMDHLEESIMARPDANHTFVLAHYPLGTTFKSTSSSGATWDQLAPHISLYMCGHLHRFRWEVGDRMYAHKAPSNLLELELGDVKKHAMFRIIVVDHDIIAFTDMEMATPPPPSSGVRQVDVNLLTWPKVPQPPAIVATHPKDSRFLVPNHEPLVPPPFSISDPVRFFVFSETPHEMLDVSLFVNGARLQSTSQFTGAQKPSGSDPEPPLWTCEWAEVATALSKDHTHKLLIRVKDKGSDLASEHTVVFQTSGQRVPLEVGIGELIIMTDFTGAVRVAFWLGYTLLVLLLGAPKFFVLILGILRGPMAYSNWYYAQTRKLIAMDKPPHGIGIYYRPRRDLYYTLRVSRLRLCELARVPRLWYPFATITVGVVVAPLMVGNLIFHAADPSVIPNTTPVNAMAPPSTAVEAALSRLGAQAMYLYGVWIGERWHPITDSWFLGTFKLWTMVLPFFTYMAWHTIPPTHLYSSTNPRRLVPVRQWRAMRAAAGLLTAWHVYDISMLGIYYGPIAVVASPLAWACGWLSFMVWSPAMRRSTGNVLAPSGDASGAVSKIPAQ